MVIAHLRHDTFEEGELEWCAEALLRLSANRKLKARIIPAGALEVPLVHWTAADGWREWVHPAERDNVALSGARIRAHGEAP